MRRWRTCVYATTVDKNGPIEALAGAGGHGWARLRTPEEDGGAFRPRAIGQRRKNAGEYRPGISFA